MGALCWPRELRGGGGGIPKKNPLGRSNGEVRKGNSPVRFIEQSPKKIRGEEPLEKSAKEIRRVGPLEKSAREIHCRDPLE